MNFYRNTSAAMYSSQKDDKVTNYRRYTNNAAQSQSIFDTFNVKLVRGDNP